MLIALKDRIPLKVKQDDDTQKKRGKGAKERNQVDVYRGSASALSLAAPPPRPLGSTRRC